MARTSTRRHGNTTRPPHLGKPRGQLEARVRKVGPEHFGLVTVDPGKSRSRWMLADFYGRVRVEPATVVHDRGDFDAMIQRIHEARAEHDLRDVVAVLERSGRCHLPLKRALAAAGLEVRIIHPYATKHFRQPAHPGTKTDDTDLQAIHRGAVSGFGLLEAPWDPPYPALQLWARHRRTLVQKATALCGQIHEHLQAALPGYAACFGDLWGSGVALSVAGRFPSAPAIVRAGVEEMSRWLRRRRVRFQRRTLERIVAWARTAPEPAAEAALHNQLWRALHAERLRQVRVIRAAEQKMAALLVETPYVLLLSVPGINVVCAGEFAGEAGPITHYANANAITGRAGLFPSRYQSADVDRSRGPLVRAANRRLRGVIMMTADCLLKCNDAFRAKSELWRQLGKDPRHAHVKVASRFCRIAFQMVAGGQVFNHPSCRDRDYIVRKLMRFHLQHGTPALQTLRDLRQAARQVPRRERPREAEALAGVKQRRAARGRGPQPIGEIIGEVLAELTGRVQSEASGDVGLS
jgi:transposase